jgi:putative lipoprotein (rSAM/lipoprotein system)
MNKSFLRFIKISSVLTIATGVSFFAALLFSGCNFDPYKDAATESDTVTYDVTGVITEKGTNKGIKDLRVFLQDTSSSIRSPYFKTTDTLGNYEIKYPYVRRNSILLITQDIDDASNGQFISDTTELIFSEINYSHGYNRDVELTRAP